MKQQHDEKEFLNRNFFELKENIKEDHNRSIALLKEKTKDNLKNNLSIDLVEQRDDVKKNQYLSWLTGKIIVEKARKVFPNEIGTVKEYLDYLCKDQSAIRVHGWKSDKIKAFLEMIMEHAPQYFANNIEKQWERRDEIPNKK